MQPHVAHHRGGGEGPAAEDGGGDSTRPTGARVRQSLFDILAPVIPGCRFLDAFAGNGGVGLEALSRGAATVVLVDKAAAAVEAAKENARALAHAGGEVQVFRQDARTAIGALADQGMRFDVVYLDPPYDSDLYEPLLALLGEGRPARGGRGGGGGALPQATASGDNRRPHAHEGEARRRPLPELLPARERGGRVGSEGGRRDGTR